jgi:hypothetical protein
LLRSDGRLRTDEEIMQQMITALGFSRRGARIVDRIAAAIAATAPER